MLMYFYIAVGSAIGGVARGWLSLTITEATGPEFPWGTILINIIGSLLIGALATGTTADGRFPLSPDVRSLLMVGLCGGFTTFSSFSLQSLELLRQGRVGWALVNIGASVVLCLAAVAAGYYGANAMKPATVEAIGAAGTKMSEYVLAILDDPASADSVLSASARLVALGGGGRIEAFAIHAPGPPQLMPTEEVADPAREAVTRADNDRRSAAIKNAISTWEPKAEAQGLNVEWLEVGGNVSSAIGQYGSLADTVVVASRGDPGYGQAQQDLHAALYKSGTAVLVIPPHQNGRFGTVVAIAWRNDPQARAAVRASLPILKQAASVHLLRAGVADPQDDAIPAVLAENGIAPTVRSVSENGRSAGEALLTAARDLGADLIVMGAFAHGEWREALIGGVTRYMLENADIPLLMKH